MKRLMRGDAIKALNSLIAEGLIVGFKTNFFSPEASGERKVTVDVADELSELEKARIAEDVRSRLCPLTGELSVTVQRKPA